MVCSVTAYHSTKLFRLKTRMSRSEITPPTEQDLRAKHTPLEEERRWPGLLEAVQAVGWPVVKALPIDRDIKTEKSALERPGHS